MESFFFNITDSRYKISEIFKKNDEYITRIDISNGVVFLDIALESTKVEEFPIKNLDRKVMISVVKRGTFNIYDETEEKNHLCKNSELSIFASSRQDIKLRFTENSKVINLF